MSAPIEHDFLHRPDFGMVRVQLKEGEKIMVEPSAMATMDSNTQLEAGFKGGFKATVMRGLAGESLIVSTYTGGSGGSELTLAPGPMGDCQHYRLDGSTRLMMERGAFLAHGEDVEVTGKFQGFSGFFSGEGLVLLQASGNGDLFFNTYGSLIEVDVSGSYYVDTGYIVAFEDTLQYEITIVPGMSRGAQFKSFFLGGEGLVCRFSGHGKLWVQTRTPQTFVNWINPFRPVEAKKN